MHLQANEIQGNEEQSPTRVSLFREGVFYVYCLTDSIQSIQFIASQDYASLVN